MAEFKTRKFKMHSGSEIEFRPIVLQFCRQIASESTNTMQYVGQDCHFDEIKADLIKFLGLENNREK